jgi:ATP-dependent RNA helicase DDX46/PRP5
LTTIGFLKKIKAGEAKANKSGFAGKGLERLQKRRDDKDRAEKSTYGDTSEALSLASREGAVIPYKPKDREGGQNKPSERDMRHETDYTFTEIKVEIVHGPAPDRLVDPSFFKSGKGSIALSKLPAQAQTAIENAKREGRTLDAQRLARVIAQVHQSLIHYKTPSPAQCQAAVEKALNLGFTPEAMAAIKTKDPDATDYHAIFPINDYPQKARWKATNKEQMTLLAEVSGASVTMRGIYYPPGEEPKVGGEPKLHLLIESNDVEKVQMAVEEIRRNIVEASVMALNVSRVGVSFSF